MAELTSKVYSKALFLIVKDDKETAKNILDEFNVVKDVFLTNEQIVNLLSSPIITIEEKHKMLSEIFDSRINKNLLNFFYVLTDKNRFSEVFNIYNEFLKLYNDEFNIMEITAVTAIEMSEAVKEKLLLKLKNDTKKVIKLTTVVDPSILGGILIKAENKEIDNTIKTKLKNIHNNIKQSII